MINQDIKEYLDHYISLDSPHFAVLITGNWGAGKTHFISSYKQQNQEDNFLYISLYGISSFSEIENQFFQLLHPILASKKMKFLGRVLNNFMKFSFKVDFNLDGNQDGSWNLQLPNIDLFQSPQEINKILIFDDIERCKIDIDNLLGYINYFVEHQGMKVIIIANEEEIQSNSNYKNIKEKVIGKTFEVCPEINAALTNAIEDASDSDKDSFIFLRSKEDLIKNIFISTGCKNLRVLKRAILDFHRIYKYLPESFKSHQESLESILKHLVIFSISIQQGELKPSDIEKLRSVREIMIRKRYRDPLSRNNSVGESEQQRLEQFLERNNRPDWDLDFPLPSPRWWKVFFETGTINQEEIELYLDRKRICEKWSKLYNFKKLKDQDFEGLLQEVVSDYRDRKFVDINVVKEIFYLFLCFSQLGLYNKTKSEILEDSIQYIEFSRKNKYIDENTINSQHIQGRYFFEFSFDDELQKFNQHLDKALTSIREESFPNQARELLNILSTNSVKFCHMIALTDFHIYKELGAANYWNVPILAFINPSEFFHAILGLEDDNQRLVFWSIQKRYEPVSYAQKLSGEIEFLNKFQRVLLEEANLRAGRVSGHKLHELNNIYLSKTIESLENL